MATKYERSAEEQTAAILANFRGNTDEFCMLKGILCMTHGLQWDEAAQLRKSIDMGMIAARMDAMNKAVRDQFLKEQAERATMANDWLKVAPMARKGA